MNETDSQRVCLKRGQGERTYNRKQMSRKKNLWHTFTVLKMVNAGPMLWPITKAKQPE